MLINAKSLFLTCDLEEFNLPLDLGKKIPERQMFEKSYEGLMAFLTFIKKQQLKATFFVTELMAERYSLVIRELVAQGHEVGFHGNLNHKNNGNMAAIARNLRNSKDRIENIIGSRMFGFRNHKLTLLPLSVIRDAGFIYDNTCHPTFVPGRYFYFFKPRSIWAKDGMTSIPISVTPIFRLPFSWIWFRNFGLNYAKFCTSWVFLRERWVNIYFHAWEFAEIEKNLPVKLPFPILNNTGIRLTEMLSNYLNWCDLNNVKTETIYHYLIKNSYINIGPID